MKCNIGIAVGFKEVHSNSCVHSNMPYTSRETNRKQKKLKSEKVKRRLNNNLDLSA